MGAGSVDCGATEGFFFGMFVQLVGDDQPRGVVQLHAARGAKDGGGVQLEERADGFEPLTPDDGPELRGLVVCEIV